MKQATKRVTAWLMVLVMLVLLFPARSISAAALPTSANEVAYVKDGSYVYNWGKRDVPATFLTTYAEGYYTGSYSYANLSALTGSSGSISNVYSSELGKAISAMLKAKQTYTTSYDSLKTLLKYTDCTESNTSKISSFYSGTQFNNTWDSGSTWNREHTWPNSKGLNGNDENDVMMVRPTVSSENNSRGNTAYGESTGYYDPNGLGQNLHGDIARLMLQHMMRWGNTDYFYSLSGVIESRAILLKWLEEDPVDTWEMGKNDAIQQITGIRNVFVDYPELAFLLLGEEVPANYTTPSGEGNSPATNYVVTALTNNANYGTVSVNGKVITASPKDGYVVSSIEVTAGTATFTQNGNTVNVSPASDCTVLVSFAAKQKYSITFIADGKTVLTLSAFSGDTVTFPTTAPAVEGYTFTGGWVPAKIAAEVSTKPTSYTSCTVSGNLTYYALYTRTDKSSQGSEYVKKSIDEIPSGSEILITELKDGTVYAMTNNPDAGWAPKPVVVTVENNAVASAADNLKWIVTKNGQTLSFSPKGNASVWLMFDETFSNANNSVRVGTGANKKFAIDSASGYLKMIDLPAAGDNTASERFIGVYATQDWRCYTSPTTNNIKGQVLGFYVLGGAALNLYTTNPTPACEHPTTVNVPEQPATCTEDGATAGVKCTVCGEFLEGHELIPAAGHGKAAWVSNNNGTHTKTCPLCLEPVTESCTFVPTVNGRQTVYTCSECGYFYTTDNVYTVTLIDCGAETSSDETPNAEFALPASGNASGSTYTLIGWSETKIDPATVTAPTALYTDKLTVTKNITLYAVYSYSVTVPGSGSSRYVLVTAASQLKDGASVIIAASGYNYALSTTQQKNNRTSSAITKSSDKKTLTPATDTCVLTLRSGKTTGTWAFYDSANGYLYMAGASSNNYLRSESTITANSSFNVSVSTAGVATIVSTGSGSRNTIRFNNGNSPKLFACYLGTTQADVALYVLEAAGPVTTKYYTTTTDVEMRTVKLTSGTTGNVGSVAPTLSGNGTYAVGTEVTVTAAEVEGYTFTGWYKADAASGEFTAIDGATSPSYRFTVSENVTLKARYTKNITVRFLANGGSFEADDARISTDKTAVSFTGTFPLSVAYGDVAVSYGLTRDHYAFRGWKLLNEDYSGDGSFSTDTDLTADWAEKHAISVLGGSASTNEAEEGATVDLKLGNVPAGFEFIGWILKNAATDTEVSGLLRDAASPETSFRMPGYPVTVTAALQKIKLSVSFVNSLGKNPESQTVNYGDKATACTPEAEGHYRFDGWYLADSVDPFDFSTPITSATTLVAHWTRLYYISAEGCTASLTEAPAGTLVTLSADLPAGRVLTGWEVTTDHQGYVRIDEKGIFTMPEADVTAKALSKAESFQVVFHTELGSAPTAQTVEYGLTATKPEDPTASDYRFIGWVDEDGKPFDFTTVIKAKLDLYAEWEAIYTIISFEEQTYTLKSGDEVVFICDGDFGKFTSLLFDGTMLRSSCYTAESGSTRISFTNEFLESLEEGDYTLSFLYEDGESNQGVLHILPARESAAPTGDSSHITLYVCLMAAALVTALALTLTKKKRL